MDSIYSRAHDFARSSAELDHCWAIALLVLRVYFGTAILIYHGWPKLQEMLAGQGHFLDLVRSLGLPLPLLSAWLAVVAQVGGSVLIILGLWTRPAALLVASTIAFGVLVVHWRDGFKVMEAGLAYSMVLIAIAISGPGWISLDRALENKAAGSAQASVSALSVPGGDALSSKSQREAGA